MDNIRIEIKKERDRLEIEKEDEWIRFKEAA
jgi:hypothetical protein